MSNSSLAAHLRLLICHVTLLLRVDVGHFPRSAVRSLPASGDHGSRSCQWAAGQDRPEAAEATGLPPARSIATSPMGMTLQAAQSMLWRDAMARAFGLQMIEEPTHQVIPPTWADRRSHQQRRRAWPQGSAPADRRRGVPGPGDSWRTLVVYRADGNPPFMATRALARSCST